MVIELKVSLLHKKTSLKEAVTSDLLLVFLH